MAKSIRVSDEAHGRLCRMADLERRTLAAVVERLIDEAAAGGVGHGGGVEIADRRTAEGRVAAGRPVKRDPSPAVTVPEQKAERYPWDGEAGPIQVPLKRPGRGAGGEVVGPEGVRPKGVSEKDWAMRKLKAQRAAEREGL